MGALLFEVAGQRYGLDLADVIEVVPAVRLRGLPLAPAYVAGVFRYRGAIVPVLDLSQLMHGRPVVHRFSTRIVLVHHAGPSGPRRVLGLLVERATDTFDDEEGGVRSIGIAVPEAPYLGGLSGPEGAMFQRVRVEHLLPEDVQQRLFVEE